MKVRLEPPIEQFVKFSDLQVPRREIPAAVRNQRRTPLLCDASISSNETLFLFSQLKQLLCRQAARDRMIGSRNSVGSTELDARKVFMKLKPTTDIGTSPKKVLEQQSKRAPPVSAAPPPAKKAKAQNFLKLESLTALRASGITYLFFVS